MWGAWVAFPAEVGAGLGDTTLSSPTERQPDRAASGPSQQTTKLDTFRLPRRNPGAP
jgi:hypothetical protein